MASLARTAINQNNSQNSTGPTSVAGKAVSRFNAMKHGLDAAALVIPGEDPALSVDRELGLSLVRGVVARVRPPARHAAQPARHARQHHE